MLSSEESMLESFLSSVSDVSLSSSSSLYQSLEKLKPTISPQIQQETVEGLIKRLIPHRSAEFEVEINPSLSPSNTANFRLESTENHIIKITGNTGVAAALGFHNYLKYWLGCHISWSGNQLNIPPVLPVIKKPVELTTHDQFRYYQNVCTSSYSFVWWKWERWEQEIDWMALNGINLPLAFTGQEAIWTRIYLQIGFTTEDLENFFTGPAFLAWNRMGNIDQWAGPLSDSWQKKQLKLQHLILKRMRSFGMIPVLPAFSGHVPRALEHRFPEAKFSRLSNWNSFAQKYSCTYLLDPLDPLFENIGTLFVKEMIKEFGGTDHVYNCDVFNEMKPSIENLEYLKNVGASVYHSMSKVDSDAVWLMQGWLFLDNFWTPERVDTFVNSVPNGRMIILDLQAELQPIYSRFESFYGQPFIWCMLHNFGGVLGMYGAIEAINEKPFEARQYSNSTMVGMGLAPEGIEQNDVVYELMNEMFWRTRPVDIRKWISYYAIRRYGGRQHDVENAWIELAYSAFNCKDGHQQFGEYIIVQRPSLYMHYKVWYSSKTMFKIWKKLLLGASMFQETDTYRYDITDIAREALQSLGNHVYNYIISSFNSKNETSLQISGDKMLELLTDMDTLLATNKNFLLGRWLEDAKSWGENNGEKAILEFNARNQITLWGPNGNILDYAQKQWSGLFTHYYYKRWKLFIEQLRHSLSTKQVFDSEKFRNDVFLEVEKPFTLDRTVYVSCPVGDTIKIVQNLFHKWYPLFNHLLGNQCF